MTAETMVEGELGPMPQWEAVGDDVPPVHDRDLDVHVRRNPR